MNKLTEKNIIIKNLSKSFPLNEKNSEGSLQVLKGINLKIAPGEFLAFIGPNGCGKTTFLSILAGLLDSNEGEVLIQGKKPGIAKIGFIFQNFSETLFPWRRALDNIAFPLELQRIPKKKRYKMVLKLEEKLRIELDNESYPYELSSGQQQFVAIARALIDQPTVLLMDEPFSALDFENRIYMQDKLLYIWQKTKTTILFVSHEIDEALYMADRVVFFRRRPAEIIDIIETNLSRPRHQSLIESEGFFRLRNQAINIFRRAIEG